MGTPAYDLPMRPRTSPTSAKRISTNAAPADRHLASSARVLRQFRQVFKAVKTHFQQVEKRAGIGGAQLWALAVIQQVPGVGITGLAHAMDIHQSTASNLVRALSDLGLVAAVRGDGDRRTVELHVLPAGKRLLRRAPGPAAGVLPEALSALDASTLARLEQDLQALLERLEPDRRAARTPLAEI